MAVNYQVLPFDFAQHAAMAADRRQQGQQFDTQHGALQEFRQAQIGLQSRGLDQQDEIIGLNRQGEERASSQWERQFAQQLRMSRLADIRRDQEWDRLTSTDRPIPEQHRRNPFFAGLPEDRAVPGEFIHQGIADREGLDISRIHANAAWANANRVNLQWKREQEQLAEMERLMSLSGRFNQLTMDPALRDMIPDPMSAMDHFHQALDRSPLRPFPLAGARQRHGEREQMRSGALQNYRGAIDASRNWASSHLGGIPMQERQMFLGSGAGRQLFDVHNTAAERLSSDTRLTEENRKEFMDSLNEWWRLQFGVGFTEYRDAITEQSQREGFRRSLYDRGLDDGTIGPVLSDMRKADELGPAGDR